MLEIDRMSTNKCHQKLIKLNAEMESCTRKDHLHLRIDRSVVVGEVGRDVLTPLECSI